MNQEDIHKQVTHPGVVPPPSLGKETSTTIPSQIGPYKIEGELDRGGMSTLYLAIHPDSFDPLVVKVLSPKYLAHPELKDHFLKEAHIISLTNHPNIVKVYGHGEWEGGVYIALEFIQGISLRQFILQHTMSPKRALEVIIQIAEALHHLHTHGVIHRDLKPENILITASGGVKVIDFGIAQLKGAKGEGPSRVAGTPAYMSPEQQKDAIDVTAATDIYSLGIVAYELVLGRLSHGAVHVSLMPQGLQRILARALQPNPEDRYHDIAEMIADLSSYLESKAIELDQLGRGYSQDLASHLLMAQETLLPSAPPQWPHHTVGLSVDKLSLSGIYYDFLDLGQGRYGVIMSEPSALGADGILHVAMLQGMIRSLSGMITDPVAFVSRLNQLVVQHTLDELFTLTYLILEPAAKLFHFISCGYGPLWLMRPGQQEPQLISSDNLALGIDPNHEFLAASQNWNVGDTIILTTLRAAGGVQTAAEEAFQTALQELMHTSPQQQTDGLLRRINSATEPNPQRRPLAVISVHRAD